MISPINFRASAGNVELTKPVETEAPKTETVTTPIENAASFKGANALAAYNKAFLAVDTETKEATNAPAFKGEEVATEEATNAPAFKGEEVATEEATNAPAFKGEEVEAEETAEEVPTDAIEEDATETEKTEA